MIEARHLSKSFKVSKKERVQAIADVSFNIEKGEIFGLLGTNGAGKTTLIKIFSTLISPDSGEASIDGLDIRKKSLKIRKKIGVCFGNRMIYYRITGRDNLKFYGRMYNVFDLDRKIEKLARYFGLFERIDDLVETYSMGMKSKIAIMRALIHDPELIFLDEPTVGLDPGTAYKLREKVRMMREMEGKTILLCTHYLFEAESLCDRIGILHQGKLVAIDSPKKLREKITYHGEVIIRLVKSTDLNKICQIFSCQKKEGLIHIKPQEGETLNQILIELVSRKIPISDIKVIKPSLEDAFLELTKTDK